MEDFDERPEDLSSLDFICINLDIQDHVALVDVARS
jgi:hypothetical protein